MTKTKVCVDCGKRKPKQKFAVLDGGYFSPHCVECARVRQREAREKSIEQGGIKAYRERKQKHLDAHREKTRYERLDKSAKLALARNRRIEYAEVVARVHSTVMDQARAELAEMYPDEFAAILRDRAPKHLTKDQLREFNP